MHPCVNFFMNSCQFLSFFLSFFFGTQKSTKSTFSFLDFQCMEKSQKSKWELNSLLPTVFKISSFCVLQRKEIHTALETTWGYVLGGLTHCTQKNDLLDLHKKRVSSGSTQVCWVVSTSNNIVEWSKEIQVKLTKFLVHTTHSDASLQHFSCSFYLVILC